MPVTIPAQPVYKTGKAGNLVIANTELFITKWTGKLAKNWADATDSSGFDATSSQLWRKQAAGSIAFEGSIEGYYDFNGSSAAILAVIIGDVAVQATFLIDRTTPFCSGLVNFEDFESGIDVEGDATVGFTTNFKSYGVMTLVTTGS